MLTAMQLQTLQSGDCLGRGCWATSTAMAKECCALKKTLRDNGNAPADFRPEANWFQVKIAARRTP